MLDKSSGIGAIGSSSRADRVATALSGDRTVEPIPVQPAAAFPAHSDVLEMAAAIARDAPPVDRAKVAALRETIAGGNYSINIAATALAIATSGLESL